MSRIVRTKWLWLFLPLLMGTSVTPEWVRVEDCDIPGADLGGMTQPSADACQEKCGATAGCAGFTYITGWQRCQLKQTAKKRFTIRMHAARAVERDGKRELESPQSGFDHKGKDMEKAPRSLKDVAACSDACLAESTCKGFVYIQGYSACWLKKSDGALRAKQFICGYMKNSN